MSSASRNSQLHLTSLIVRDFRNIVDVNLQFSDGHHLFLGPNGHGKTNCLEAIALACSLKPMQPLQSNDLIRMGTTQARIVAHFAGSHELDVSVDILPRGKKAKLNNNALRSGAELARSCPLVTFIPAELNLVAGGHSLRRRALDQAAASLFAEHVLAHRAYEKALTQRNRLLKDGTRDFALLKAFTDVLIKEGALLMHARLKTIELMNNIFNDTVRSILGKDFSARVTYCAQEQELHDFALGDITALLMHAHERAATVEQRRRVTMFGPHLDDVNFIINDVDAKSFASRGQTRALVFAFKLAQMMAIHQIRGYAPIIILDDIVSELDEAIKANLIATVATLKTQAFFSTTDRATFGNALAIDNVFAVRDGCVMRMES